MKVIIVTVFIIFTNNFVKSFNLNPDAGLDIYKFLEKYKYPVETHYIHTEDGYVLRMQRLPVGRNITNVSSSKRPAVLIMHGILCSGMDFVNTGPEKALALILSDQGYDVWLGNNRGTTWSRNHLSLDPDFHKEFWDYSFETCGNYDLPAKIDYILKHTGHLKLTYIGHSQGTTQFFAMAALRPEYNKKIAYMAALAPVAYVAHTSSPIFKIINKYKDQIEEFTAKYNISELFSHSQFLSTLLVLASSDGSPLQEFIATVLFLICGFDSPQLNRTILPVVLSNLPAGISIKMLEHFGQEMDSGYFQRYDYGDKNVEKYGSSSPPNFDLSAITAPVGLYYSLNDLLSSTQDVVKLAGQLPNLVKNRTIDYELFNHFDFLAATDIKELLYDELLEDIKKYVKDDDVIPVVPPHTGKGHKKTFTISVVFIILFVIFL